MRVLDREVQLPSQGADEIHAQQYTSTARPTSMHWPVSQGNARVVERRIGQLRQHVARRGPATTKQPRLMVMLRKVDRAVRRQHLAQIVAVVALGGAGAHHVEMLVGDLGDGELGADAAAAGERVAQRDAADLGRHLVGHQSVEPGFGAGTGDFVLGEGVRSMTPRARACRRHSLPTCSK
jgi:hypothetical protein